MAQILPQNPGSTEIQSPLIAGITEGLNKISATLSLKIGDLSDVSISAVPVDSSEKNKNRIYEAETGNRLWLSDPAPVIKKNGEVIEQTSERFTIDYVGGSITFPEDSKPSDSDTLTVTCKYIIGTSETISQIQDQLSQTSEKASKYKGYFETEGDLKLEHPTASDGDFALVMSPLTIYAWTSGGWKDTRADANLDAHLADFNNPHRVDVEQIGAETPEGAQQKADEAKTAAILACDPKGSAYSVQSAIESGNIVAKFATELSSVLAINKGGTGATTYKDVLKNVGASPNINFLYNSYFCGDGNPGNFPINHMGKQTYTGLGKNIDGWTNFSGGAGYFSFSKYGIIFTPVSQSYVRQNQIIPKPIVNLLSGKTVTLSILAKGNYRMYANTNDTQTSVIGFKTGNLEYFGIVESTFTVPADSDYLRVEIGSGSESEATISAVKLELGNKSTLLYDIIESSPSMISVPDCSNAFWGQLLPFVCSSAEYSSITEKDENTMYIVYG